MKKSFRHSLVLLTIMIAIVSGCGGPKESADKKQLTMLDNEKWWGGAVMDGRNSPLNDTSFVYDEFADCKTNQAAPFFISSKGRYIWSDKPLRIGFNGNKISVDAHGGVILYGRAGETLRDAYLFGSRNFFPPSGKIPDSLMITSPQYNTWIELQYNQNESDIMKYAEDIVKNDFPVGVIMIDDNWQQRYGTWKFDCEKFSDPAGMMKKLHAMGFRVMLWVVPFVSSDSPVYRDLAAKGLLIFSDGEKTKPAQIEWWNGVSSVLDLSNPESLAWFRDQLKNLVAAYGVDGFKLDAGDPERYAGTFSYGDYSPNDQCEAYAKLALDFPMNELRACWKMAGQPLVQRLRDKRHTWEDVQVLIPDMIGLGMIGHQFGCPDMIGGGESSSFQDSSVMDQELIVRSSEVSALMPMMQFSVAPWRVLDSSNLAICRKMAGLHYHMGGEILAIARECAVSGEPMVRNLEYGFPGRGYEEVKDQFLLGDRIMVAPVVKKGERSRKIIFPEGSWTGDDGSTVKGPAVVTVDVPLDRLPWYRKMSE